MYLQIAVICIVFYKSDLICNSLREADSDLISNLEILLITLRIHKSVILQCFCELLKSNLVTVKIDGMIN